MSNFVEDIEADNFTISLPLKTEKWQDDMMRKKFNEATVAYNETLDEFISRGRRFFEKCPEDPDFDSRDERDKFYDEIRKEEGLYNVLNGNGQVENDLKKEFFDDSQCGHHLTSEMLRTIMGRAVDAVSKWTYGECEKPHFKSSNPDYDHTVDSIVGYNDIMMEGDQLSVGSSRGVKTMKLAIDKKSLRAPSGDRYQECLKNVSDYGKTTIVRKKVKGEYRYFVHFTCDEPAPINVDCGTGRVGIDIGVRTIAVVSEEGVFMENIVDKDTIDEFDQKLSELNSRLNHKIAVNNPEAFDEDGSIKRNCNIEHSNRMNQLEDKMAELYRKMVEEKKRQHYELINRILEMGDEFVIEDNTYSNWQESWFGKQVQDSAPKTFVRRLVEKVKAVNGTVHLASTWDTKLSSRCHCGREKSSDLSDRWHSCECGVECQRDLYSAFLAKNVFDDDLDEGQCREDWPGIERSLHEASREFERATGVHFRGPDRDGESSTCAKTSVENVGQEKATSSGGSR